MAKKQKEATPEIPLQLDAELLEFISAANKNLKDAGKIYFANESLEYSRIPTGILGLDYITGGGLPRGRLTEFYGAESSGKSTASLEAAASCQRSGGVVLWIAREGFDRKWATTRGVDLNRLLLIDTLAGDVALEAAMSVMEKGLVDLMVFDSVQSFMTTRESEDSIDTESFGNAGAGQMWGRVMRRAQAAAAGPGKRTAIIAISQVRSAIGQRGFRGMPPEPEPTGIKAIRHWKDISVQFKKGEPFYINDSNPDKKQLQAREFKMLCKKNKTAVSERTSSFRLNFLEHEGIPAGLDHAEAALRLGVAYEVIEAKGAWRVYGETRIQGADKFAAFLRENPKVLTEINKKVLEATR